jgi:hypothetical protein
MSLITSYLVLYNVLSLIGWTAVLIIAASAYPNIEQAHVKSFPLLLIVQSCALLEVRLRCAFKLIIIFRCCTQAFDGSKVQSPAL